MARGRPSRRRQMSMTAPAFSSVSSNAGFAACARSTKSCTAGARDCLRSSVAGRVRRGAQRRDVVDLLAADAQHDPARHQEARVGRDGVQADEHGCGIHDLLEVVEHDEHASAVQRDARCAPRAALRRCRGCRAGARSCGSSSRRLEHVLQRDEVPGREELAGGAGDLDREAALADPAGTDEGHEPRSSPPSSASSVARSRSRPIVVV